MLKRYWRETIDNLIRSLFLAYHTNVLDLKDEDYELFIPLTKHSAIQDVLERARIKDQSKATDRALSDDFKKTRGVANCILVRLDQSAKIWDAKR